MLPRLLHRLVADSVLSASQADAVRTLLSDGSELSTARAVNLFLSLWLEADKKGARTSSPCSVLQPDTARFPGLQPTTFRADNFDVLFLDEQKDEDD